MIRLRTYKKEDTKRLALIANNPSIAGQLMNRFPHPYSLEDAESFIQFAVENPKRIYAIEYKGELVGGVGIHPQDDIFSKNAELGYWLGKEYWGKGIASEVVKQIIPIAFEKFDITRLFARPFHSNTASQKVLEKNGFALEATIEQSIFKNGEFYDELVFGLRRP